jgi:hypothetical protein
MEEYLASLGGKDSWNVDGRSNSYFCFRAVYLTMCFSPKDNRLRISRTRVGQGVFGATHLGNGSDRAVSRSPPR